MAGYAATRMPRSKRHANTYLAVQFVPCRMLVGNQLSEDSVYKLDGLAPQRTHFSHLARLYVC